MRFVFKKFGVRARLAIVITMLLAGVSGTQYVINYTQQQRVFGKLLELNRQINEAIRDIDVQLEARRGSLARASADGQVRDRESAQTVRKAMISELQGFLEFVDHNLDRILTQREKPDDILERIHRLRQLTDQQAMAFPPDGSFFQVTVSVMEEVSRRTPGWRYTISTHPLMPVSDDVLQVSIPIVEEGQVRFVHMQYQISDFLESLRLYRITSLVLTLVLMGLGLVFAVAFSGRFTRPIRQLNDAFIRVEKGDLDFRVAADRTDEIGQLMIGFNHMVDRLKKNKDLEKSLYRQERLGSLGQMAAGIAHEIKNPLNAINLTLQHLGDKLGLGSPGERELFERYSRNIQREVTRLGKIVDTFLNFSRMNELKRERVDLHHIIEEVLTLMTRDAQQRGIRIIRALAPGELVKEVDPEKIKTLLLNLIINAIQAMPSGGRIRITTELRGDGFALITVSDTGCGIPSDQLERIFDLYYSTKPDGSGLGLAIVNNIVRDHGGEIKVSSTLGTGSDFTVALP